LGLGLSILIGIPAGVAAAVFRNSIVDRVVTVVAVAGVAIPGFWLAIMLILVFGVRLRWLPPSGFVSLFKDPAGAVRFLVLPVFAIPGMGRLLVNAVSFRDIAVVQAIVLVITLFVVTMNLVTDLGYIMLDPRIRYA